MKKYIFILLLFLLAYEAYPQVRLSAMDSVTSFQTTDLFWLNRKVTSTFYNRKVSWSYLRSNMIDYIDGLANTWALGQTFTSRAIFNKGAIFSAASYGIVTFSDSVLIGYPATLYLTTAMPQYGAGTGSLGSGSSPFYKMYANEFVATSPTGADSIKIKYNSTTKMIDIEKLNITNIFSMDSSVGLSSLNLLGSVCAIGNVNDTTITIDSLVSNAKLTLPGVVSKGIETINIDDAYVGSIIIFYHTSVSDSVLFEDETDGNLKMQGSFWLRTGDNIAFMYMYDQPAMKSYWMELWRKNN